MKNLVIFGAPGAGKGTQSSMLIEKYGYKHISTGDLFRRAMKEKTALGVEAQTFIDKGSLVPDSITYEMVKEAIVGAKEKSFILDGYPRNLEQATSLANLMSEIDREISGALFIDVPQDEVIDRLSGRRVCEDCGASFHLKFKAPTKDGICDSCGGNLIQRKDDKKESIATRLNVYTDSTLPLKAYYRDQGIFIGIDGSQPPENVFKEIEKKIVP